MRVQQGAAGGKGATTMGQDINKVRCSAVTKQGSQCRRVVLVERGRGREGQKPVCHLHAAAGSVPGWEARRCEARRRDGGRCRKWAVKDSERIHGRMLCFAHCGRLFADEAADDARRCTAMTRAGRRCGKWAMKVTRRQGKPLCDHHAGLHRLPDDADEAAGRRCTAMTAAGKRCPQWAARGSEARWGRALCGSHGPNGHTRMPGPEERRCTATTANGTRCRCWAMLPRSDVPESGGPKKQLCWIHAHPDEVPWLRHGYHRQPAVLNGDVESAEGEIALLRLKLDDLMAYTEEEALSLREWITVAGLVTHGLRKVAEKELERRAARRRAARGRAGESQ